MSFNFSEVKWGRVIAGIVLGAIIAIAIPILYVVVRMVMLGFQLGGNPPPEAQVEFLLSAAYAVVAFLATALGGFLGGRLPARRAEGSYLLNGLVVGVGLAIVRAGFSVFQFGSMTVRTPLHAILAIAASALGGWIGGRAAEAEAYI
jgi:putative membrane protein (TIGR04086 family)